MGTFVMGAHMTYHVNVYMTGLVTAALLAIPAAQAAAAPAADLGSGVVVAVLDTGVTAHPALGWSLDASGRGTPGGRLLPGYDFVSDAWSASDGNGWDADPSDRGDGVRTGEEPGRCAGKRSTWHGTNVTGTVLDIAPGARVVPVRIMGRCGGNTADVAAAVLWALGEEVPGVPINPNPASIVNLSLSGVSQGCSRALQTAIDVANERGAVVVAAAGSTGADTSQETPANCRNVLVVGSTDKKGVRTPTSGFGTEVALSALGGDMSVRASNGILTTTNKGRFRPGASGFGFYQSSSAATARVSGALADIAGAYPDESGAQWRQRLLGFLTPFASGACDRGQGLCGDGILDLKRLLNSLPA